MSACTSSYQLVNLRIVSKDHNYAPHVVSNLAALVQKYV